MPPNCELVAWADRSCCACIYATVDSLDRIIVLAPCVAAKSARNVDSVATSVALTVPIPGILILTAICFHL